MEPTLNRLSQLSLCGCVSLLCFSGIAEAQVPPPPPPPAPGPPAPVAAEESPGQVSFGVSGFAGLPIGDFGDAVTFGLGVLGSVNYGVSPQLELAGRAGFIYFIPDSDLDITFYDIPLWFGARYAIDPSGQGVYLHGEVGLNMYHIKVDTGFGSASDTENELGINLLAGFKQDKLRFEGGLYIGSIDESSDSMMVGATGGTTF